MRAASPATTHEINRLYSNLTPSFLFSLLFAAVLLLSTVLRLWLAARQLRHVAQHRKQVPAAFENAISLAQHQRAADYTVAKGQLALLNIALSAAIVLGWTLLGGLNALNELLMQWLGARPRWQPLALLASFAVISSVLEWPLALYQTFVIEQRHGFNRMSLGLWLSDVFKSALVAAIIGLPLAALVLWLMDISGTLWWLWTWLVWLAFSVLMMMVYPSVIAPLFNRFKPLQDEALNLRVQTLMARCGFSAKGLFVMDSSRRSGHANAYFTGFGAAKRVVLFDTLLKQLDGDEIESVLAHELGHFKHKHVLKRMLGIFGFGLLALALLGWLAGQSWFYTGLGVSPNVGSGVPNNALALLLFLLALPVFGFFLTPVNAALSRRDEFQADAYAARMAQAGKLVSGLVKLHKDNASTLTPDPLYARFYYSHPPAAERIAHLQALAHASPGDSAAALHEQKIA